MMQRGKQTQLIGIAYPMENIGVSRYQGVELSATHQKTIGAFSYFITANASFEKSEVIYMDEIRREYDWNRRTGQPVGMPFGYLSDGLILTQAEAETAPSIAGYTL